MWVRRRKGQVCVGEVVVGTYAGDNRFHDIGGAGILYYFV